MEMPRVELDIVQDGEPWGTITLELEDEKAPDTVRNFLKYVDEGFYDGTIFHRVIENFMIQGGGYVAPGKNKPGLRSPIKNEAANGLKNLRGTIAMARTSEPHSATSQFFINVVDNDGLDHPGSGWGYCVFGRAVEGMEVVERIRRAETKFNPQMGESSQPAKPPSISKARRAGP